MIPKTLLVCIVIVISCILISGCMEEDGYKSQVTRKSFIDDAFCQMEGGSMSGFTYGGYVSVSGGARETCYVVINKKTYELYGDTRGEEKAFVRSFKPDVYCYEISYDEVQIKDCDF